MSSGLSDYPPLVQILLKNRGIVTREEAERFLAPNYERDTYDPFLLLGMERAVVRIMHAIEAGERIVIFSDYDCDGIPGAVILHDFFKKIGYENFQNYIPHRHGEGYGMNIPAIEQLAEKGAKLLITVDCGITEVAEVARANELGIDVIITDHHIPADTLPSAYAIVNPKQEGDIYPDQMLCGAAVAWKLVSALLVRGRDMWDIPLGWEKWLLDMAGLATIADMVPLRNENRALAYYGLTVLRKSRRVGLRKLLARTGTTQTYINEDDIGFTIGPRINAASRMGTPSDAFRLLVTDDEREAEELADHLVRLNETRKGLVASMVKEARRHIDARIANNDLRELVVIGNPLWKPALVGLVAGNLAEAYARPIFAWGRTDDGTIKGSCRSDGTCDVQALMVCKGEIFLETGGHALAGGFSVSHEMIHTLEDELVRAYQMKRTIREAEEQMIDGTLMLNEVTFTTWNIVERFAPFGIGNPKPIFLFEKVRIADVRMFGKEKTHLELSLESPPQIPQGQSLMHHSPRTVLGEFAAGVKAISFFSEEKYKNITTGDVVDLVATMELNTFRGRRELRLRIVDVIR